MLQKSIAPAFFIFFIAGLASSPSLQGEPLKSAVVAEVKGEVVLKKEAVAERPAVKDDAVKDKDVLTTGKKSRAELEFADKSIARLGSNTVFSFDPLSRNMKLERGTALIHVPPGKNSTTQISSPAATASVIGDVIEMGVAANGTTQIIALSQDEQGPVKVTLNKTGEVRTLKAGEMLVIDPLALKIPEPMSVSVDAIAQSSGLVGGFSQPLPKTAINEINQTQQVQAKEIANGQLEGNKKLEVKTDGAAAPGGVRDVAVQSAASSGFAGFYQGVELSTPGCNGGPFSFTVGADGKLAGAAQKDTLTGFVNTDGTFTITSSDGGGASGRFTGSTFTGTTSGGTTCNSTIQGSRQ